VVTISPATGHETGSERGLLLLRLPEWNDHGRGRLHDDVDSARSRT